MYRWVPGSVQIWIVPNPTRSHISHSLDQSASSVVSYQYLQSCTSIFKAVPVSSKLLPVFFELTHSLTHLSHCPVSFGLICTNSAFGSHSCCPAPTSQDADSEIFPDINLLSSGVGSSVYLYFHTAVISVCFFSSWNDPKVVENQSCASCFFFFFVC